MSVVPPQSIHQKPIRAWVATLFLVVMSTVCLTGRAEAAVYNLHLVTDNGPDYTDIAVFRAKCNRALVNTPGEMHRHLELGSAESPADELRR